MNFIFQAFGNAKTAHNNNSSRFGKFIQVNYRQNGMVHGAMVQKYLLEKSRIVSHARNERNYHVFYYLLAGASIAEREYYKLEELKDYRYLNQSSNSVVEGVDEAYEFLRLKQSMEMVGFSVEKQRRLFSVLSAVLHLGNIEFVKKKTYHHHEAVSIKNPELVSLISSLLKFIFCVESLRACFTVNCIIALMNRYEPSTEAIATRDALAKCLYGALFDWIVMQVNHALLSKKDVQEHQGNAIGVLDIFGFEDFGQQNSFEQFCINFANEHLQYYFNQHVFRYEQTSANDQKPSLCNHPIKVFKIMFFDFREKNLDLMRTDIVSVLKNSSMSFVRELVGVDPVAVFRWAIVRAFFRAYHAFQLAGKVYRNREVCAAQYQSVLKLEQLCKFCHPLSSNSVYASHKILRRQTPPKKLDPIITEKIACIEDGLPSSPLHGLENLLCSTEAKVIHRANKILIILMLQHKCLHSICFVPPLEEPKSIGPSRTTRKQTSTVTAQFQYSLSQLMVTLSQASPFFVRCIKSNGEKVSNLFDDELVQRQLRYTGMLETVRIRQAGYNVRLKFEKCFNVMERKLGKRVLQCVFLRESEKLKLDEQLHQAILAQIVRIQRWVRCTLERRSFLNLRNAIVTIQSCVRGFLARRTFQQLKMQMFSAAVCIQKFWRGYITRTRMEKLKKGVVFVQRMCRGNRARIQFKKASKTKKTVEKDKNESVKMTIMINDDYMCASKPLGKGYTYLRGLLTAPNATPVTTKIPLLGNDQLAGHRRISQGKTNGCYPTADFQMTDISCIQKTTGALQLQCWIMSITLYLHMLMIGMIIWIFPSSRKDL
ncbi:Unconventional myosin-IXb [Nymphon striatum]|nr:Unconventional myosin-IXb [Nymphon striatum]